MITPSSQKLLIAASLVLFAPSARAAPPSVEDCLTSNESAIKLRNDHKLRASRAQLLVCAASSCPTEIREECERRLAEANAQLPSIVIEVTDAEGRELTAVKVTVDGEVVAEKLDGTAILMDPGEHALKLEMPGRQPVSARIVAHEGEKGRRERYAFGSSGPASPPPATSQTQQPGQSQTSADTASTEAGMPTRKKVALAIGGLGVVGVGVGSVLGIMAKSAWDSSQSECATPTNCPHRDDALRDHDSASGLALGSTIAMTVGLVALAGGAALWFTTPSTQSAPPEASSTARVRVVPWAAQQSGGAFVAGTF
jgi:serine/threonine-protein kinase